MARLSAFAGLLMQFLIIPVQGFNVVRMALDLQHCSEFIQNVDFQRSVKLNAVECKLKT